jgi:hypothetical protein
METAVLNDQSVLPNDEIIFSIIGDKELLWKQTLAYLYDNNKDISEEWKYYKDGENWLFRTLKKKKTLFWIRVLKNTFKIGFWFADKFEPLILQSDLPDYIKTDFQNVKRFGKSRCINIEMTDSNDFETVKKLIYLKLKAK